MQTLREKAALRGWPIQTFRFGIYNACNWCGHLWRERHPQGCPNCKKGAHWISSHHTRADAEAHVPLRDPATVE